MFYFLLSLFTLCIGHNFTNCYDNISSIKSLILDPDPIRVNDYNNIIIYGITKDIINTGNISVQIYYSNTPIYFNLYNLCSMTSCPIKNDYVIIYNANIPQYIPAGVYNIKINITNLDCIMFDTQVTEQIMNY